MKTGSFPTARLRLWIECKTISGPGQQEGPTSKIALASQEHEAGVPVPKGFPSRSREPASEIVMASQEQETGLPGQGMTMVPMTSRERKADTSFPTAQQVLNLAASKYLTTIDPSKPEELNGFVCYLEKVRKTLIVDTQSGSLIITVECRSLEMLDELWSDYCTGFLNEMAQIFLVTEEILRELGLTEVKLTTTILEEEYRACQEYLLQHSGKSRSLYEHVCCFCTLISLKATKILSVFPSQWTILTISMTQYQQFGGSFHINILKSLMIHHLGTKVIMTATVFGYLILISIDFYNFISPFSP